MLRLVNFLMGLLFFYSCSGQDVSVRLTEAFKNLDADTQLKHAIISLYVIDSKTGKQVFNKNAQAGLAPASCQKVITSTAAFELLGPDFRYKTVLAHDGKIEGDILKGNLHIVGSGDPTLGSSRWGFTKEKLGITKMGGSNKKSRHQKGGRSYTCR